MPERSLAGVEDLIGLVDSVMGRYELLLCDHCKDGQHKEAASPSFTRQAMKFSEAVNVKIART